jgi:NDP-sugar pyrophosphorylase family protein
MIAVIIAGGEGTRLRPLTFHTPKALVPVCSRPLIDYQVDLCRRHGVTDIVVNLHYLADEVTAHLGDGSRFGVRIRYSREIEPLGTAGAVRQAAPYLDGDAMLVFNGDVLTGLDLSALLAFHRRCGAAATLAVTRVPDPAPFGLVLHGGDGRVEGFLEKPSPGEAPGLADGFWINAGTYILHPDVLTGVPAATSWSFERQVFPALIADGAALFAFRSEAYWLDCGSPESYLAAHRDLLSGALAPLDAWRPWPSEREVLAWVGDSAELPADLAISGGPVFVGAGASIGSGVRLGPFAVLGQGAVIDDGAQIDGTVVGRGAYIGRGARLAGGIIGAYARIEADVRLNGRTVLADYSVIGRGTCLG